MVRGGGRCCRKGLRRCDGSTEIIGDYDGLVQSKASRMNLGDLGTAGLAGKEEASLDASDEHERQVVNECGRERYICSLNAWA